MPQLVLSSSTVGSSEVVLYTVGAPPYPVRVIVRSTQNGYVVLTHVASGVSKIVQRLVNAGDEANFTELKIGDMIHAIAAQNVSIIVIVVQ